MPTVRNANLRLGKTGAIRLDWRKVLDHRVAYQWGALGQIKGVELNGSNACDCCQDKMAYVLAEMDLGKSALLTSG